ncbi:YdaS family helix-turn-helix protein [Nitrosospira sp. Nsp2]|uniref:transcriptional regulator n=1 Tax=Nitrosospira sp. Nsp2 TaxID=136548 RepID=UPI000D30856A|nr:YdaS family helix-turn-helix protein [Nitrosospira sp. Nsp2]
MISPLQQTVTHVGGQVALAKAICDWHYRQGRTVKVSQAHVWAWLNISKTPMPPAEHCIAIAAITDWTITPHKLRPDLYPHPHDGLPENLRECI